MKHNIAFRFFIPVLFLISAAGVNAQQQQQYTVSGNVIDGVSRQSLANATIVLLIKGIPVYTDHSNSDGYFSFPFSKLQDFTVRVTLNKYRSYISPLTKFNRTQFSYNLGTIALSPTSTGSNVTATIVNKDTLIHSKMMALGYVPTQGAKTLFYAMNPGLRDKNEVPSNYLIKYPVLPKFKSFRKAFNKRYKKDKKRKGPYIYTFKNTNNDKEEMVFVNSNRRSIFNNEVSPGEGGVNYGRYYVAKTKKFVFVFFKLDAANHIQYQLYKYKVVYYSEDQKNNPGEYNQSGDATYGYALLTAHIYDVEVYDQTNGNKKVGISDDSIDPNEIIQRHDLYKKWNKILIQVYD